MKSPRSPEERHPNFEDLVWMLLKSTADEQPGKVLVRSHPSLKLHNGQTVIPDFELTYELPFQNDLRLIECQDRTRSSQDILHKIRSVRAISSRNRFIFIYSSKLAVSSALRRSLQADGVVHYDMYEFASFLEALSDTLEKLNNWPMSPRTRCPNRMTNLVTLWEGGQSLEIWKPFARSLGRRRAKKAGESDTVKAQIDEIKRDHEAEKKFREQTWFKEEGARLGGWPY